MSTIKHDGWWSSGSGKIELKISEEQARMVPMSGQCDHGVALLLQDPEIEAQVEKLDKATVAEELKEYGAWSALDLLNHTNNIQRLLWIAASDVNEGAQA